MKIAPHEMKSWLSPCCNVMGPHNFLAQNLEAKIVSMVSVQCHAHRLASACYFPAAYLYNMVYETAKAL